ncbi:hypothetical protein CMV_027541 [Castanea mollissima]|uniref:Uncharacterized protein n=1 Tax=Castanea mollissima TaxID=60419 RepID=A0A8J4QI25_9ROSI|nr:hypothetical protein CMV_027541 [Castanea mollissima]
MMSGDNFTDGFGKTRPALADVTNRKRSFPSASGDIGLDYGGGYGKKVGGEDEDSKFAKQGCLGVENLVQEECVAKFGVDGSEKEKDLSPTCSEVGTSLENIASTVENLLDKSKETLDFFQGDRIRHSVAVEVGDVSRDSCVSSISAPTCSGLSKKNSCGVGGNCQDEEVRLSSSVTESNAVCEGLVTHVCKDNEKDQHGGRLASSNYGSVEWSRLPKSHELERCTSAKGDGCANLNAGTDVLKGCSCSFCLKAAHMWSDLHYQDIKGRIAVLKKSQKEASILVQNSCRGKEVDIHGQGNCNKVTKLDPDLTGQWKSLFLHMENIFVNESNQLQSSYVTLKDLRENCKMDLEMINGMASDKH